VGEISEPIGNTEQLPVAWMTENGTIFDELPPISSGLIPLYTHPMRELTVDEIHKLHQDVFGSFGMDYISLFQKFAQEILKKASEK
jgi:hypothetical protein